MPDRTGYSLEGSSLVAAMQESVHNGLWLTGDFDGPDSVCSLKLIPLLGQLHVLYAASYGVFVRPVDGFVARPASRDHGRDVLAEVCINTVPLHERRVASRLDHVQNRLNLTTTECRLLDSGLLASPSAAVTLKRYGLLNPGVAGCFDGISDAVWDSFALAHDPALSDLLDTELLGLDPSSDDRLDAVPYEVGELAMPHLAGYRQTVTLDLDRYRLMYQADLVLDVGKCIRIGAPASELTLHRLKRDGRVAWFQGDPPLSKAYVSKITGVSGNCHSAMVELEVLREYTKRDYQPWWE